MHRIGWVNHSFDVGAVPVGRGKLFLIAGPCVLESETHARMLADAIQRIAADLVDFGKVLLHVPISGSFPTMNSGLVGYGLEGVELVDDVDPATVRQVLGKT